jgi:hypothetical protein
MPKREPAGLTAGGGLKPALEPDPWVNRVTAERILGLNSKAFGRLVATGRLTTKSPPAGIPGHTLYSRPELEALRKSMVTPATRA